MFEVPESDIICVRIDKDVCEGKKPIEFIRAPPTHTENAEGENGTSKVAETSSEQIDKAKTYA